jgi:prepilin-type N-terminal cleavage/methylation domain-containing protein
MHKKGFTLIELLITISILSILSGILLWLINPASLLSKGRDARRLSDLDSLNKAIALAVTDEELTLIDTGVCSDCGSDTGTQAVDGTGYVKFTIPTGKTGLSKFLPSLPLDPGNFSPYVYIFGSTTTGYEIHAVLESPNNAVMMSTDGGDKQDIYEIGSDLDIIE